MNDYEKRARELDNQISGHQSDEEGPFTKELKSYGANGRVLIPVIGAFAEVSTDTHAIAELCASLQADQYCASYKSQPEAVNGVFKRRIYRTWGMKMHQGWARRGLGGLRTAHSYTQRTTQPHPDTQPADIQPEIHRHPGSQADQDTGSLGPDW